MSDPFLSYDELWNYGIPKYSRVHLARMMREGRFPASVQISANRVGWRLSEIEAWKASRPTAHSVIRGTQRQRVRLHD